MLLQIDNRLPYTMSWVAAALIAGLAICFFAIVFWRGVQQQAFLQVTKDHFAAIVGSPAAAVAALFLVLVIRIADGPIEVELGILKFKGAAAPIVFWMLCFLAIVWGIKQLWGA